MKIDSLSKWNMGIPFLILNKAFDGRHDVVSEARLHQQRRNVMKYSVIHHFYEDAMDVQKFVGMY